MLSKQDLEQFVHQTRVVRRTKVGAKLADHLESQHGVTAFGPLEQLVGEWKSLPGHGWNMIALPFATKPGEGFNYRLLVNQYNEELTFTELGGPVPNRGIKAEGADTSESDQFLAALQYFQKVTQIASDDFPRSSLAGKPEEVIHEEPGLWLHITNETTKELDIARLGTVPHGDSLLGLGTSQVIDGPPVIPEISGLPIGVGQDLHSPYLTPYLHFHENLFENLFDPVVPNALLEQAIQGQEIVKTTVLSVDTTVESAGIRNIPFIVKQADATEMKFTFWIEELARKDKSGDPVLQLQYSQTVFLDFFDRRDGKGKIRWPHVSINTLVRKDQ